MKKILFSTILIALLQACCTKQEGSPVVSWQSTDTGAEITFAEGTLTLTPQADNAIRVQFAAPDSQPMEELIFTENVAAPGFSVEETDKLVKVKTDEISAEVCKKTGAIAFRNAQGEIILQEQAGGRLLKPDSIQGEPTFVAGQTFLSPKDEYLYGMGQFQDGYLNIRGLSRQLRQVNTQICLPMMLSSKGYGLLWHNYGLVDFNPADSTLALQPMDSAKLIAHQDSTRPLLKPDEAKYVMPFNGYTATLDAPSAGRYVIVLEFPYSSQKGCIIVDGKTVYDNNNPWLPPRTPVIVDLTKGKHQIEVISQRSRKDKTGIRWRKVDDLTTFRSPVAQTLDYTVFAGYGDEVISSFRTLSGNVPMMPLWAVGYTHCRERFHTQAELLENARGFRERHLPVDLFVQDWQYWGKYGWNAMKFDETIYPKPAAMVKQLHDMNIRLMVSVWSKLSANDLARQFHEKGYLLPGHDWIDFFNPSAAAFYWENFRDRMASLDIDAWWLDATEPEGEPLKGIKINGGTTPGEVYLNTYPLFVNKTVYEGYLRDLPDKRTMILTRSGFLGMQRYGVATWSGDVGNDWATLRREITGGLGQMSAGLPWWTYDAGGFYRPENQYTDAGYHERLLRWFQAATFIPMQRIHGFVSETEFWRFGETVETVARKYLDLRYRMLPYIYSEAANISFNGSTLMRPLVFDFAKDRKALEQKYEFMFGPALLVAPVVEPNVEQWSVYLPANNDGWYNFWTGEKYAGGTTVSEAVDIAKIPLFVRAGSIIPLAPTSEYSTQKRDAAWEIRIYPGADAEFTVYEDEGDNNNYRKGEFSTYTLRWDDAAQTLTVSERKGAFSGMVAKRTLNIVKMSQTGGIDELKPTKTVEYEGAELVVEVK